MPTTSAQKRPWKTANGSAIFRRSEGHVWYIGCLSGPLFIGTCPGPVRQFFIGTYGASRATFHRDMKDHKKHSEIHEKAAANLKKTFELIELTKKLNMAEDARKNPDLSEGELRKRFSRRMVYLKDIEKRRERRECLKKS